MFTKELNFCECDRWRKVKLDRQNKVRWPPWRWSAAACRTLGVGSTRFGTCPRWSRTPERTSCGTEPPPNQQRQKQRRQKNTTSAASKTAVGLKKKVIYIFSFAIVAMINNKIIIMEIRIIIIIMMSNSVGSLCFIYL